MPPWSGGKRGKSLSKSTMIVLLKRYKGLKQACRCDKICDLAADVATLLF